MLDSGLIICAFIGILFTIIGIIIDIKRDR